MEKNQAVINFISQCPTIKDNPLYFNFINAKDNNKQFITTANDTTLNRPYIDGSVLKRYTFTIIDFKSITYNAIPKIEGVVNENVEDLLQVQDVIDWVTEQADNKNYPDFGEDCQIEDMRALSDNPMLNGVDTSVTPALAKYSMSIQIEYIDMSKVVWN